MGNPIGGGAGRGGGGSKQYFQLPADIQNAKLGSAKSLSSWDLCKNNDELNAEAQRKLGIPVSFGGTNRKLAIESLKAAEMIKKEFPDAFTGLKTIATTDLEKITPGALGSYAPKANKIVLSRSAHASREVIMEKLNKSAKTGFIPEHTNFSSRVVIHELGHAWDLNGGNKTMKIGKHQIAMKDVTAALGDLTIQNIGKDWRSGKPIFGKYATTDRREAVAELFTAAFSRNATPYAKAMRQILRKSKNNTPIKATLTGVNAERIARAYVTSVFTKVGVGR